MTKHRKLLTRWQEEGERSEEELAAQVPELAHLRKRQAMTVESVAARLPEGSLLIEYLHYLPKTFAVQEVRETDAGHYLALVLPAGGADRPALVDLGPAAAIDGLVRSSSGWWPFGRRG